jgi:hypothetical protein
MFFFGALVRQLFEVAGLAPPPDAAAEPCCTNTKTSCSSISSTEGASGGRKCIARVLFACKRLPAEFQFVAHQPH